MINLVYFAMVIAAIIYNNTWSYQGAHDGYVHRLNAQITFLITVMLVSRSFSHSRTCKKLTGSRLWTLRRDPAKRNQTACSMQRSPASRLVPA